MKIHVKIQNTTYEVKIGDLNARPIRACVDGETFEVWPEEVVHPSPAQTAPLESNPPVSQVNLEAPGDQPENGSQDISAPIPGVIIAVSVKEGDKVAYGQELCILEAMKMKNSIRSNRDGIVQEIFVSTGDQVKHGQVLIRFQD
ncbi:MAG: biotin/lipoyl-binding protein [Chloroflexi bacterium]|nr:biotin/lipoyl-binding protein [Chloroflexota bacterium]